MGNRDLLRMIWSNLNRMRARVTLTAIGVVIGTAAVVVLISLGVGLQRSTTEQLGSIGDINQITVLPASFGQVFGGPPPPRQRETRVLNDAAVAELKRLPHVVAVSPQVRLLAAVRLNRLVAAPTILGLDPSQIGRLGWEVERGTLRLNRGTALAGARLGERFAAPRRGPVAFTGAPPGGSGVTAAREGPSGVDLLGRSLVVTLSRMGETGQRATRNVRVRVVGVLKETGGERDFSLILPLRDVEDMNAWVTGRRRNVSREGYEAVLVQVESSPYVLDVQQQIQEMGFLVFSLQDMLRGLNLFFAIMQAILGGIGAIALLVAAFGIANTMTMAIYERTREIGIMKAIGATNRDVMRVFLGEAGAIGFLGGVVGVLIGVGLSQGINVAVQAFVVQQGGDPSGPPLVYTPPWLMAFAVAFATVVGVLSGIYPALRAAGLRPVEALRYE